MQDLGRVQVLHSLADLVHDVPVVQILQNFLAYRVVQVGFHEFEHQVEILIVVGANHVVEFDYVGVGQIVEVADLSICALGVD